MNLKYYLRGLGLGILVTAIIMGAAGGMKKVNLTNDEIKARAKELGMIENQTLSDLAEGTQEKAAADEKAVTDEKAAAEQKAAADEKAAAEQKAAADEKVAAEQKAAEEKAAADKVAEEKAAEADKAAKEKAAAEAQKVKDAQKAEEQLPEANNSKGNMPSEGNAVTDTGKIAEKEASSESVIFSVKGGDSSDKVARRLEDMGLVKSAAEFDDYMVKNGYDRKLVIAEHTIPPNADVETIAKVLTSR